MFWRNLLAGALCLVGWLLVGPAWTQETASETASPELPQNVSQWLNFQPVSVQSLKGKGLVLYFFEEGCPRCRERWPALLETAKKYEGQPVMFIAVNSGSPAQAVSSYTREVGIAWPVIIDADRSLEKQFSVPEVSLQNIFQTVVVTPTGQIQRTGGDFDRAAQMASQGAAWKVDPAAIPADLKAAWLAMELGNYAQAGPVIRKSLTSTKSEVKDAAEKLDAFVQQEIATQATSAAQLAKQAQKWKAYKTYRLISAQFAGFKLPDSIVEQQRALEKDPAVLAEQKAFLALEAAKKMGSKGNPASVRRAKAMLERIVADSPDTDAAADAQAILNKLPAE